jgi:hypothetical protein
LTSRVPQLGGTFAIEIGVGSVGTFPHLLLRSHLTKHLQSRCPTDITISLSKLLNTLWTWRESIVFGRTGGLKPPILPTP